MKATQLTIIDGVSDGSFWEIMKTLEDQGAIIYRPTKQGSSSFSSKSLRETTDNNSNLISTSVSLSNNTPVYPNFDSDIFLLSEGIDSLEQLLDTQLQNVRLNPPVREQMLTTNLIYANNESDILIESRYNSHVKKITH